MILKKHFYFFVSLCLAFISLFSFAGCVEDVHVHVWQSGKCTECGEVCTHLRWNKGECSACGILHTPHKYTDGKCLVCGAYCTHTVLSAEHLCLNCGTVASEHHFTAGKCVAEGCNAVTEYEYEKLSAEYLQQCANGGTVETVEYVTEAYSAEIYLKKDFGTLTSN